MAKKETFAKKISIHLTDLERSKSKDALVDVDKELHAIASSKATAMADYNSRLKDKRAQQVALIKAIDTGVLEREVECYDKVDERRGHMVTYRKDTDEQVDERPLTAEERDEINRAKQTNMFDGKGGADPDSESEAPDEDEAPTGQKVVNIRKAKKKASKKPRGG